MYKTYHRISVFLCFFVITLSQNLIKQDILPKLDIILVGTNDIHGTAYPITLSRKDTGQKYSFGGLVYMAKIIQILKEENNGNVLYLDAGDQFQGGLQASKLISSGQIVSDYFNHMKVEATSIGNHQFDEGKQFLDSYLQKLKNNILSSNFLDTSKNQLPLQKQQKSKLYKFPIKDRTPFIDQKFTEIKIGVIGLSTLETPYTSSGFVDGLYPQSYKFENYTAKVLQEANNLKQQGAHALILVTHVGNACNNNSDYGLWSMRNQQSNIPCQKDDEIFKLIDQLPNGLIDAIVQGHRHTQSRYFYKGIPIIGNVNGGFYLNTIRLRFSLNRNSAFIEDQDLLIQGPIPVCAKIFEGTRKCEYVPPENLQKAGLLIQWKFHGKLIEADSDLVQIYQQKYAQKMKKYQYQIVENYISSPFIKDYAVNSSIGNLITNVIANSIKRKSQTNIDFVILNGGGFRTSWYPGVIKYGGLHSMFPFDNQVILFKILGSHLKKMLQIVQNGYKKYYPTWGLQQKFVRDPSHKIELHKIKNKHLLSLQKLESSQDFYRLSQLISTISKKAIVDEEIYTGVTVDFLINGGDDFAQVVNKPEQINFFDKTVYPLTMKDLIQIQLQAMKQINEKDLIGPNGMQRLIFIQNFINKM